MVEQAAVQQDVTPETAEGEGDLQLGGIMGAVPAGNDNGEGDGTPAASGEFAALLDGIDPGTVPAKYLKDGKLNASALLKSAQDFEKKARGKAEVPDAPDGYEFEIPENLAHLMPAKADDQGNPVDDPLIGEFKKFAHENGMDKGLAAKLVPWFLETVSKSSPDLAEPQLSEADYFKQEIAKLGPDGMRQFQTMQAQIGRWVQLGVLSREQATDLTAGISTAEQFSAFQTVMKHLGMDVVPTRLQGADGSVRSKADLQAMRYEKVDDGPNKGRYRIDVDPSYRAEVDQAYEEFYGNAPAGSTRIPNG